MKCPLKSSTAASRGGEEGKLGLGSGHISDAVSGGPSKIKLEIKIRGSHQY